MFVLWLSQAGYIAELLHYTGADPEFVSRGGGGGGVIYIPEDKCRKEKLYKLVHVR